MLPYCVVKSDINCSVLPSGMGGNGEFDEEIREEIILNEVRLGGRATINVTLTGV